MCSLFRGSTVYVLLSQEVREACSKNGESEERKEPLNDNLANHANGGVVEGREGRGRTGKNFSVYIVWN